MGMMSPEMFLTKICMVSTSSGETERDPGEEERMLRVDLRIRDVEEGRKRIYAGDGWDLVLQDKEPDSEREI